MIGKFRCVLGTVMAALTLVLAACGNNSATSTVATSTQRGTLVDTPPFRIASLSAAALSAELGASASGKQLLQLAGAPACGVDFYYMKYWTVGPDTASGAAPTEVSGALMVPTGSAAQCSGARPIVLYAHGTQFDASANIADVTNPANTEGAMIAAIFAAQGDIVVAPNYAGYDISNLGYHPYLEATQNADDMIDALAAARAALPHTFTPGTTDSGSLFVTGYSEGGYVAMATDKAMQAAGMTVTASAPMSGPYALEALFDAVMLGHVDLGSTAFAPLITTSYQHEYGNIYQSPSDIYSAQYASGIETLLPSLTPLTTLFQQGKLPETALFSSSPPVTGTALDAYLAVPTNPLFALGFGNPYLITNAYRLSYVEDAVANPDGAAMSAAAGITPQTASQVALAAAPQNTFRQALKANDMRDWTPQMPMLLCGGDQDPTVFFSLDTGTMAAYWSTEVATGLVKVLDVNATPQAGDPFAPLETAFQQTEAQIAATSGAQAAVASYHATVAPFCAVAARSFFSQF